MGKKLINNEMLVRDIIDLDTNFLDDEKLAKTIKEKNKKQIKLNNETKKDANENKKKIMKMKITRMKQKKKMSIIYR